MTDKENAAMQEHVKVICETNDAALRNREATDKLIVDLMLISSDNARLRAELAEQAQLHRISVNAGADAMRQLKADLDAAQKREEAAERDLTSIAQEMFSDDSENLRGNWYPCDVCANAKSGEVTGWECWECFAAAYNNDTTAFKWRGPDAGGEGKP